MNPRHPHSTCGIYVVVSMLYDRVEARIVITVRCHRKYVVAWDTVLHAEAACARHDVSAVYVIPAFQFYGIEPMT